MPSHLRIPDGELVAKGDGLGMDIVRSADHGRVTVLLCSALQDIPQGIDIRDEEVDGVDKLEGEGGVDDIGAGETLVNPAGIRPHRFGEIAEESDDVVLRL